MTRSAIEIEAAILESMGPTSDDPEPVEVVEDQGQDDIPPASTTSIMSRPEPTRSSWRSEKSLGNPGQGGRLGSPT
ncbi:hypothetical protein [Azospirillum doebereinerae]